MGDGFQSFPGRHDLVVRIGFFDLALRVQGVHGEITRTAGWPTRWPRARAMEVQVRVEFLGVEVIDRRSLFLWTMAVTHSLADHRPVLAFRQGVIVSVARA